MNSWKNLSGKEKPAGLPEEKRFKFNSNGSTYSIWRPVVDCSCNRVILELSGCKT